MQEITLIEMQQIELNILLEFDSLCRRYGLRYYIDGGTLLGAMCYEGFIPWDDDIDLKMPRPDYERFLELTQELPKHICVEKPSKEQCEYLFVKLVDTRTLLIENPGENEKRSGVYVDLFPMDGYPEDLQVRERHLQKLARLNTLFHYSQDRFSHMKFSKSKVSRLKGHLYNMAYSPFALYQKLEKTAMQYNYDEASSVGLLIEGDAKKECFRKCWLEPAAMLEFESHRFPAPNGYREHLRTFYGDHITNEEYYHNLPKILPNHKHLVYWINGEERAE